jgi:hypothetical protein
VRAGMHSQTQLRRGWVERTAHAISDHLTTSWEQLNAPDNDLGRVILGVSVALGVLLFGVIALFFLT